MKLSENFFYTIREDVKDEDSISGKLLVKSGMIKKTSSGIYMYMPLGLKVINNIEKIVREEMDKAGANELLMPSLLPEEVYVKSGRRDIFKESMFTLKDRYDRNYCLGPTHEELFCEAAKMKIKSYKDMPFNIYQIGAKYRDEARPRYGMIRVREFFMKDAYSFDTDDESCDISYKKMYNAYKNIFDRIGINYKIVTADTGAMGGLLSEEFQAVTDIGEDILVTCKNCDYASNIEVSKCITLNESNEEEKQIEKVYTPNVKTIEEVANFLNVESKKLVKTLVYKVENKLYACLVAGDRELNEVKLAKLLNAKEVELASPEEVDKISSVGFVGPVSLNIDIIMDDEVKNMKNFCVGANEKNYHLINVNVKDFNASIISDIKNIKEDDICPNCHGTLEFKKGIEIGNTFKLGVKYSNSMNLMYLDKENKLKPVVMGCYGIGIGRIMASVVEQNNDDKGIIWPTIIAPYKVGIVVVNAKDEQISTVANNIYETLKNANIDTILDDRDERVGVKFNDMDLIGTPIRITVGKKVNEQLVEVKLRNKENSIDCNINDVKALIEKLINE